MRRIARGDYVLLRGDGRSGRVEKVRRIGYPEPLCLVQVRIPHTARTEAVWLTHSDLAIKYRRGVLRRALFGRCQEGCV
jgi:hypothetical protein